MAVVIIIGVWAFLGWSMLHARRQARSGPGPDAGLVGPRAGVVLRRGRLVIPDTVPTEWIESYRDENGGG